jgi:hypothetical protein
LPGRVQHEIAFIPDQCQHVQMVDTGQRVDLIV